MLDKAKGKQATAMQKIVNCKASLAPFNKNISPVIQQVTSYLHKFYLPKRLALHNRITDYGDIYLNYDEWGNVIEKSIGLTKHQTFSYDCENRLVKAQTYEYKKLINESYYTYDALGRRVKKQISNL